MFKEGVKYQLTGIRPVGISYSVPRIEIAEFKDGSWYAVGCGKKLSNFIIEEILEEKSL